MSCSISILLVYMYVRMPSSPGSTAGVPSSQALPGFLITAPPSVCVPDVISALAVWIQNQKKSKTELSMQNQFLLRVCAVPTCCVFVDVCFAIPLLFVCLRLCISSNPRSIAGVLFDSAGRFRATLLLRTTCMRS